MFKWQHELVALQASVAKNTISSCHSFFSTLFDGENIQERLLESQTVHLLLQIIEVISQKKLKQQKAGLVH